MDNDNEYALKRTDGSLMRKKEGAVEYMIGFFILTFVCILVLYSARARMLKNYKYSLKDGLDAACLAAALIDLNQYGSKGRIEIDDFEQSLQTFLKHLEQNVKGEDGSLDGVKVHHFIIYNVTDNKLNKTEYFDNGMVLSEVTDYTGLEQTPNGKAIQGATVYAKVGTWVKGLLSDTKYVYEESCIDVFESL